MWAAPPEQFDSLAGATLLLIEDDVRSAEATAAALVASGCTVWHAETGADARAMLRRAAPDAILLDLTLPDVDGLVLCPRLLADAGDAPIIVCSAAGDRRERLLAFRLGAEDFIDKPFDLEELQARLIVALRRRMRTRPRPLSVPARSGGATELGTLNIDVGGWRVRVANREVHLTPTEFKLLAYLASRGGEIVSRQQLAHEVWGDQAMSGSRTIDAYLRRLRKKVRGPGTPQFLHVRGMGYQLVPCA